MVNSIRFGQYYRLVDPFKKLERFTKAEQKEGITTILDKLHDERRQDRRVEAELIELTFWNGVGWVVALGRDAERCRQLKAKALENATDSTWQTACQNVTQTGLKALGKQQKKIEELLGSFLQGDGEACKTLKESWIELNQLTQRVITDFNSVSSKPVLDPNGIDYSAVVEREALRPITLRELNLAQKLDLVDPITGQISLLRREEVQNQVITALQELEKIETDKPRSALRTLLHFFSPPSFTVQEIANHIWEKAEKTGAKSLGVLSEIESTLKNFCEEHYGKSVCTTGFFDVPFITPKYSLSGSYRNRY